MELWLTDDREVDLYNLLTSSVLHRINYSVRGLNSDGCCIMLRMIHCCLDFKPDVNE